MLKKKKVHAAWDAVATRWYNYNYAQWYGIALFSYWFVVMFIAGICNLTYFLFPGFVKSLKGGISNTFRKYITLPALFKKTHAHHKSILDFPCSFANKIRIHFGCWLVYYGLDYEFDQLRSCQTKLHLATKSNELGRKIADRTGQIYVVDATIGFVCW